MFSKDEISKIVKNFTKVYTFNSIANAIISSVLVLFMAVGKGFTQKEISLILGVLPLISVFTFFIWGIIIDKYKKLVFFNKFVVIINIITLIMILFVDNFTVFFILTLIRNIGMQPNGVANEEYILNLSNRYNVSFGKIKVFGTIGYGIAGIITAVALIYLNSIQTKAIALGFLIPALYYLFKLPEITGNEETDNEEELIKIEELKNGNRNDIKDDTTEILHIKNSDKNELNEAPIKKDISQNNTKVYLNFIEILKNREYVKFIFTFCLLTGVITSSVNYGNPTILIKLGAPESLIGLVPILMILFEIVLLTKIETFRIYKNINLMLIVANILLLFRWFILGTTNSYVVITILALIHGVINGLLLPLQNRLIWNIVPKKQHSTAFILTSLFCYTIFPAIINLIIGGLTDIFGIKTFGIVYLAISLISLFILIKKPFKDGKRKIAN